MLPETSVHPILIVRKKYEPNMLFSNSQNMDQIYAEYVNCLKRFIAICNNTLELLISKQELLDKALYLKIKKKLKKQSYLVALKGTSTNDEPVNQAMHQYEVQREKCILARNAVREGLIAFEECNREELKHFLRGNKEIRNMLHVLNRNLYQNTKRYLKSEFDSQKKKLRKVEIPLTKIITRATTKTSPNFHFNSVTFNSTEIPDFNYLTKPNQVTPNYVFFHSVLEHILLSNKYISFTKFKLNSRITKDHEDVLYIFKNESDNYKIFKSKDVLYKTRNNQIIELLHNNSTLLFDIRFFCDKLDITHERATALIKKLFDIGVLDIEKQLTDRIDIFSEFSEIISDIVVESKEDMLELLSLTESLSNNFKIINEQFSIEIYDEIIELYHKISELLGIEAPDDQLLIYGDKVEIIEENPSSNEELSTNIVNLLSVFPIFDINEKIKNEFAFEIRKYMENDVIEMNHPGIMKVLTDVNLKYGRYWADPWVHFESESQDNQLLFQLMNSFVDYLERNFHQTHELDLTEQVNWLSGQLEKNQIKREGYYSIFYQHDENNRTIINKIYPGYGSFYQRFLRYTNILENYGDEIRRFYTNGNYEIAELHETLAFNANVVDEPYYKTKYMDGLSKNEGQKDIYQRHVYEENSELHYNNGNFILVSNDVKYKPVISSSLIRALYPGKFAFVTSIFSNISFMNDLSLLWLNKRKPGEAVLTPRMRYEDIILERKHLFCETSYLLKDSENTEENLYLSLRGKIRDVGMGSRFYVQTRKKSFDSMVVKSISFEFNKPQYIDFNNILLYKLFLNILNTNHEILISEELPEALNTNEYMREVKTNSGEIL
jgi:hypothetical protein